MLVLSQDWIAAARAERYRRTLERRVQTIDEAQQFIAEVGFAFFWPIKGTEAPDLFSAIAGRVREVPDAHDDPDISRSWSWKDQSLGGSRWYYAKLLRRRATLIAPYLQATFYALTHNYGDLYDYLERVLDGAMTHEARLIYEALLEHGPLDTVELRRQASMSSKVSNARFERGLVELQVDMKVLPVGVAETGAWHYSFIYDIPMRCYPDLPIQARAISTSQAWQTLIGQYVDNTIAVTGQQIGQIFHVFEPTRRELQRTLETLVEAGRIEAAQVEGGPKVWVSVRALEGR